MQKTTSLGKRLTMEETVDVYHWVVANPTFVNGTDPAFKKARRMLKDDLGIAATPNAITRILAKVSSSPKEEHTSVEHGTVQQADTPLLRLIAAVEYLYDELGESRHEDLVAARSLTE